MEQVEGFLGGQLDYKNLRGGTGPLVYPAGFVYLFAGIRWLTNGAIFPAQVLGRPSICVHVDDAVESLYNGLLCTGSRLYRSISAVKEVTGIERLHHTYSACGCRCCDRLSQLATGNVVRYIRL